MGRGDRDCSAPSGHLAFLQDWEDLQAYAFPSFALLRAFLNKARGTRNLDLTLIAPYWPRKEWFPDLLEAAVEPRFVCQSGAIYSDSHFPSVSPQAVRSSLFLEAARRLASHEDLASRVSRHLDLARRLSIRRLYRAKGSVYRR